MFLTARRPISLSISSQMRTRAGRRLQALPESGHQAWASQVLLLANVIKLCLKEAWPRVSNNLCSSEFQPLATDPDLLEAVLLHPYVDHSRICKTSSEQKEYEKRKHHLLMVEFVASIAIFQLKHGRYIPKTPRLLSLNCANSLGI